MSTGNEGAAVRTETAAGFYLLGLAEAIARETPKTVIAVAAKTAQSKKEAEPLEQKQIDAKKAAFENQLAVNAEIEVKASLRKTPPVNGPTQQQAAQNIIVKLANDKQSSENASIAARLILKQSAENAQQESAKLPAMIFAAATAARSYLTGLIDPPQSVLKLEALLDYMQKRLLLEDQAIASADGERAASEALRQYSASLVEARMMLKGYRNAIDGASDSLSPANTAIVAAVSNLEEQLKLVRTKVEILIVSEESARSVNIKLLGATAAHSAAVIAAGNSETRVVGSVASVSESSRLATQSASIAASFALFGIASADKNMQTLQAQQSRASSANLFELEKALLKLYATLGTAQSIATSNGILTPAAPLQATLQASEQANETRKLIELLPSRSDAAYLERIGIINGQITLLIQRSYRCVSGAIGIANQLTATPVTVIAQELRLYANVVSKRLDAIASGTETQIQIALPRIANEVSAIAASSAQIDSEINRYIDQLEHQCRFARAHVKEFEVFLSAFVAQNAMAAQSAEFSSLVTAAGANVLALVTSIFGVTKEIKESNKTNWNTRANQTSEMSVTANTQRVSISSSINAFESTQLATPYPASWFKVSSSIKLIESQLTSIQSTLIAIYSILQNPR